MQLLEAVILSFSELLNSRQSYIPGSILWTVRRCRFKLEEWLQQNLHKWQANGFSPVLILFSPILWTLLRCRFKLEDWLQQNVHKWQANGLSPV